VIEVKTACSGSMASAQAKAYRLLAIIERAWDERLASSSALTCYRAERKIDIAERLLRGLLDAHLRETA
jgi:hypothetical protein